MAKESLPAYNPKIKICSVDDCSTPLQKRDCKGLCGKHYFRLRQHGSTADPTPTTEQRFWSKVIKTEGCWLWTAKINSGGYGCFSLTRRNQINAHRYSFFLHYGYWPLPMCLHSCDNAACVNPHHLRPGTHEENMMDKQERNRTPKGETATQSKLTNSDVLAIRLAESRGVKRKDLAASFRVSKATINAIIQRRTWKHI